MKTPTWDDLRAFVHHDSWVLDKARSTDHDHFEKTLAEGEILMTRVSRGSKTISPGRFKAILSDQLSVSQAEFWEVLRTRKPAPRPSPAPQQPPPSLPLWLAQALEREVGQARDQIAKLDLDAARLLLDEARAMPRE